MTFLDCLNSPKFDFTQNLSGGKIIKFQQSQALTSHFESFLERSASVICNYLHIGLSCEISSSLVHSFLSPNNVTELAITNLLSSG